MAELVSIIMPCCNAGRMVERSLRSILAQTHPHFQVVFVDNNSTDGSLERAQHCVAGDPRFTFTTCPTQGANHARIHGYGLATGRAIQWMDADDELTPNKLERQVAALARTGDDIAYCGWRQHDHGSGAVRTNFAAAQRQFDDQILRTLSGIFYPPISYLLRREAADRLHAMQAWWPGRAVSTDFEYSAIAALLGMRFRFVPDTAVIYNLWSTTQLSSAPKTVPAVLARARYVRDILTRLQGIAADPAVAARLRPKHRPLLFQNCDLWSMPPGSVRIVRDKGRNVELIHATTAARLDVRPREAAIARAMQEMPVVDILRFHIKVLCTRVPELTDQHPLVAEVLERFREAGLLTLVSRLDAA